MKDSNLEVNEDVIGVIGLGYVGFPLAMEFSKVAGVIGYDKSEKRINELKLGIDSTLEVSKKNIMKRKVDSLGNELGLCINNSPDVLKGCNIYIIAVPTNIDSTYSPDFSDLFDATTTVANYLSVGDIVIFESTVYPGATEEECIPILEKVSGLQFNKEFFCGYSPERISPGDKSRTLTKIVKVTSGSTKEIAKKIDSLYNSIIEAGTFMASSIKVAEASKAIENAQRDVNISFVNEMALIFDRMNIDTSEVLEAAGTKWNFLKFKPGLVGGHCIGIDPYLLAYKAKKLGYHPDVILSGRKVNDMMGLFVANKVIKLMLAKGVAIQNAEVLICGITFKENCPDIRNTKVIDILNELSSFGCRVEVFDPLASSDEVQNLYNIKLIKELPKRKFNAVIMAVAHNEFINVGWDEVLSKDSVMFDVKGILPLNVTKGRL